MRNQEVFCDSSGDKIAVIQKTGAGVLTISEMDKAATTPQTYTGYPTPELRTTREGINSR